MFTFCLAYSNHIYRLYSIWNTVICPTTAQLEKYVLIMGLGAETHFLLHFENFFFDYYFDERRRQAVFVFFCNLIIIPWWVIYLLYARRCELHSTSRQSQFNCTLKLSRLFNIQIGILEKYDIILITSHVDSLKNV